VRGKAGIALIVGGITIVDGYEFDFVLREFKELQGR
jgi:hypothetical protein